MKGFIYLIASLIWLLSSLLIKSERLKERERQRDRERETERDRERESEKEEGSFRFNHYFNILSWLGIN